MSDQIVRKLFITALVVVIFLISLFAVTAFAFGGSILAGGRMSLVLPSPTPIGSPPWICPSPPICPPPGDLQQRLIGPEQAINTLADVTVYSPANAKTYRHILIPKGSPFCPNPRPGALFIGRGTPIGPGGQALLMTFVACSK